MACNHPVYDTDKHFIIDSTTKRISIEGSRIVIPQHTHKAERFTFEIARTVEGHDMSLSNVVEIHFQNVSAADKKVKSVGIQKAESLEVVEDKVVCSWLIEGDATKYEGILMFALHFSCVQDGIVQYNLPTLSYTSIQIGATVWNSEAIEQDYRDVIAEFEARISALEEGGIVTDEQIAQAVEDYLVEHPVEAPEVSGVVKSVNGIAPDENGNVQIETGGGAAIPTVEPADDDIPKVYFTGTLPTSKSEGDLRLFMRYVSKTARYEYPVTLKVQGGSSADYAKKNFTLKPYADDTYESKVKLSFKNWGKLNKFVLKAHWVDHSHVRNVGTAKIWGKIVASRSDYASLPEELRTAPNNGATDGFTCKVFCNGVYQGLYEWIVPKDKLFGQDSDIASHSIMNSEWNNQPTCAFATTSPTINGNWSEELQDSMSSAISTSFANFIKFVAGSTDEEFVANAENYFDVQSVIDFNIFARVFCIVDNLCRNQIFFTYDGVKWYEGCWDVDGVLGLPPTTRGWYPYNTEFQSGYIAYTDFGVTNMLYKRVETLFADRFKERYAELRANVLSADNIIEVYERLTDVITTYEGLLEEDYAKTTGDGAFTGIPYTDSNNIQQLRNFVAQRLPYMDEAVEAIGSDNGGGETEVPCTGITLSASTLNFATQDPQTLTATVTPDGCTDAVVWSSDNEAIAVVNNGLVTPYGDGNCNITVTCGNYSATCAVTVQDGLFGDSAQLVELVANTGANAVNGIQISSNPGAPGVAASFSTSNWVGRGTSDYVEIKEGFDCIEVLASKVKLGFYDSAKTLLKSADAGDIIDKFICTIPEGSVYYRVSVSTSDMTDYAVSVRYHNLSEYKADVAWKADPAYLISEDGSVGEGTYYMTEKVQIPDGASAIVCDSSAYEKYRQAQIAVYDASDALLKLATNWVNNVNYTATLAIASYENPTYAYFAMMNPQTAGTTGTEQIAIYAL